MRMTKIHLNDKIEHGLTVTYLERIFFDGATDSVVILFGSRGANNVSRNK